MILPFFACQRQLERLLANPAPLGAADLSLPMPSDFALGDRLFISDPDGTNIQALGAVRTISGDGVTVQIALNSARSGDSLVWRASGVFQLPVMPAEPAQRSHDPGIRWERSVGGTVWSVRTGAGFTEERLILKNLSAPFWSDWREWLETHLRGGIDDFTWVDETAAICRVRLLDTAPAAAEYSPTQVTLAMRLAILEAGGYA